MKVLLYSNPNSLNWFIRDLKEVLSFAETVTVSKEILWIDKEINEFDIIIFQWPEELFQWRKVELDEKISVYNRIKTLKREVKIGFVIHNLSPHKEELKKYYSQLYEDFYELAHFIVHLGLYSKKYYLSHYSFSNKQQHIVINHPLYESLIRSCPAKHKSDNKIFEIGIIGTLRTDWERNTILKLVFSEIGKTKFVLNNTFYSKRPQFHKVKKFILWLVRRLVFKSGLIKAYPRNLSSERLSNLVSSLDALMVVRNRVLNSGNLYLALTYNKPVLVPNSGNLTQVAYEYNIPMYQLDSFNSILSGLKALKTNKIDYGDLSNYNQRISIQLENSLNSILKN